MLIESRLIKINKAELNLLQLAFNQRNTELLDSQDVSYRRLLSEINLSDRDLQYELENDVNYSFVFTSDSGKNTVTNLLALSGKENCLDIIKLL